MHVWYVDAGIEDTHEPVCTHDSLSCLVLTVLTSRHYTTQLQDVCVVHTESVTRVYVVAKNAQYAYAVDPLRQKFPATPLMR